MSSSVVFVRRKVLGLGGQELILVLMCGVCWSCFLFKTYTGSNRLASQHWELESRHGVPPLTQKLFATDTNWQKEKNQFSPMECYWVYQPHSRAGAMHRSTWPMQNEIHGVCVVVCLFVLFTWWGAFCLFVCFLAFLWVLFIWFVFVVGVVKGRDNAYILN